MTITHTTIGIELEYIGGIQRPLNNIRSLSAQTGQTAVANIVDERGRYNTTFFSDRWVAGCDGTVDYEIKSHPLRDTAEIATVMRGITLGGGSVDRRCGTHVHVGIGGFETAQMKRLGKAWLRYEKALDNLHPRSRSANNSQWCQSNYYTRCMTETLAANGRSISDGLDLTDAFAKIDAATDARSAKESFQSCRSSKLNLNKFESIGTAEFRGHAGTLNFAKIDAWISLITAICKIAEGNSEISPSVASWDEMLNELLPFTFNPARRAAMKAPRIGTAGRQVWDHLDGMVETAPTSRFFTRRSGRTVIAEQKALAGYLAATLNVSLGNAKNNVSRWAENRGHAKRVSGPNTGALRTYLDNRKAALTRRGHNRA